MNLDLKVFDNIHRLNTNLQHFLDSRLLKSVGITSAQHRLIKIIDSHTGIEQKALSNHLFQSEAATSRMVKQLSKIDILIVIRDEKDARRRRVSLTQKGKRVYDEADEELHKLQTDLLRNFSPSETDALRRLLEKFQLTIS